MSWQFQPYVAALFLAAGLGVVVALVTWRRRATPGGAPFALLMLASAEWTLMSALEKLVAGMPAKVLCSKIQYLGIASVAPLWLMFALGYTQQNQWLTRRNTLLLWIMPVITVGMAATNEWHRLLWSSLTPSPNTSGLVYGHGPWFWASAAYNYLLLLVGTLALVWAIFRFPQIYRRQAVALLIGVAIPWVGNIVYLAGWSPFPDLDLTPFAFTLTGLVMAWSLFRFQLFDIVPVAREVVIESMSDGVMVLDAQNRIVDINPAAQRMLGAAGSSPVGQSAEVAAAAWPDLVARYRDVPEAQTEIRVDTAPGGYFDLRISPLYDHAGRFTGRLVVVRDITERKRLEKMRDDLVHTMVHDLRNPLVGISASLEMLAADNGVTSPPVERGTLIDIARTSARRMLGLVNSILDVSWLESGQMPLERERARLGQLVDEALRLQAPRAAEKKQHLTQAVSDGLPLIALDAALVGRVLENLIGNAIKFTPEGGAIHVTARHESDKNQLAVSVSDDGPGIQPAMRDRLFQKFVPGRVPGRGSGLGLAFCRLAVEAHGGRIWVASEPGRGATFTFTLPLGN